MATGAPVTRIEFIKQQLKGLAPSADWNMGGIDRLQELAEVFERNGITDLWQLKLVPVTYEDHKPGQWVGTEAGDVWHPAWTETVNGYAFDYYGKRFGFLGGPDEFVNEPIFDQSMNGHAIAWSARGHGNVSYMVQPNKAKTALEIVPVWASSSDAGFIRGSLMMALAFFASVLLPVVGTAVGTAIGSSVVPASFAAAYPGVTAAIGNIAISTALNGGDVEKAVKGAALGYVGGIAGAQAGGFALSATDSQLIGNLASVAARTAIQGGDIKQAVGLSLINAGATGMFNFDTEPVSDFFMSYPVDGPNAFTGGGFDTGNFQLDFTGGNFNFDNPAILPVIDFQIPTDGGGNWYDTDLLSSVNGPQYDVFQWNPFVGDVAPAAVVAANAPNNAAPPAPTVPPPPNSTAYTPQQIVQGITQAALQALSVIKAYRQLDAPVVQTTARVVRPDGSVAVIGDNGLVQTRTANGQVVASRPPVGVPQATLNGNYIVNNGDGTYSVVSPNGQTARYSYGADAPQAGGISPVLIGGGLLLAVLLLKK